MCVWHILALGIVVRRIMRRHERVALAAELIRAGQFHGVCGGRNSVPATLRDATGLGKDAV